MMEQIKCVNCFYINDFIFLKKIFYIFILIEFRDLFNGLDFEEEKDGEEEVYLSNDEVWLYLIERKK